MDPQPSWKKEHPMDTQVIQEKGLPMDSHNPSVRRSTLGTPNLLWTKDTSCSLWPQDMGTPRTSHYKHQRPPMPRRHSALHPARFHIFIRKKTPN